MTNNNSTTAQVVIDARFAGGHIEVVLDDEYTGEVGVLLEMPGHSVWLFPHEARALSGALRDVATTATRINEKPLLRRTDVVNDLIELEG